MSALGIPAVQDGEDVKMASMDDLEVLDDLERKRLALRRELEATGGLMVAFSGGVDSSLLLAAAVEALGPRAVAATGVSPSLAERELEDARAFATELGVRHVVVPTHEQDRPGYLANGPDRCYFCKAELFEVLALLAEAEGLALAVGTNADDLGDWRPGQRAAAERGVRTPLVAAGFSKRDVREASRRMGLRTCPGSSARRRWCGPSASRSCASATTVSSRAWRCRSTRCRCWSARTLAGAWWRGSASWASPT